MLKLLVVASFEPSHCLCACVRWHVRGAFTIFLLNVEQKQMTKLFFGGWAGGLKEIPKVLPPTPLDNFLGFCFFRFSLDKILFSSPCARS